MQKTLGKILIINTARLGDFVSGFSAVNPLKQLSESIDIICHPAYEAIVSNEDHVRFVTVEEATKNKYDLALDFTSVSSSRAISKAITADVKIGNHSSLLRKIKYRLLGVYTHSFKDSPRAFQNMIDYHKAFTEAIGVQCDTTPILNRRAKPKISSLFDLKDRKPIIGIHISATDLVRQIPIPLIQDITKYIDKIGGASILIGDSDIANIIGINSSSTYYREANIEELQAILSQLDFLIGSDSGVLHLAAALNISSLGLFGPTLPSIKGPSAACVDFIGLDLECRPCRNSTSCEFNTRCMTGIQFEEIQGFIDSIVSK